MTRTEKTCEIQWYEAGEPTPDQNPAIGMCRILGRTRVIAGRKVSMPTSRWYYICADHARFLSDPLDPEMDGWEFRTELEEDRS